MALIHVHHDNSDIVGDDASADPALEALQAINETARQHAGQLAHVCA
jgi:hypothetical protein